MHVSEAILPAPTLAAGALIAAIGVGVGLRGMNERDTVKVAVLSSALFVATLIRAPLGVSSAHLILNGLGGLILGWQVFPAFAIALFLQAILFGHGGISTLGVNIVIMATPGLICFYLFHARLRRVKGRRAFWTGFTAGVVAIVLGVLLLAAALYTAGSEFLAVTGVVAAAHIPVMLIEGLATGAAVSFLLAVRPETLLENAAT